MNQRISLLFLCVFSLAAIGSRAQINTAFLDSIPFTKAKKQSSRYDFNHPAYPYAQITMKSPKSADKGSYGSKEAAKDFGAGVAEAIFGSFFESTTTREMNWLISGRIESDHEWLNWGIELYCYGELQKEKVKVKNDDGSNSVQTVKTILMDWENDATAFIIENEEAIGKFMVINSPRQDSLFYNANKDVFNEPKVYLQSKYKNKYYSELLNHSLNEYALLGTFREKKFVLIANGESRNMWFFVENKLVCMFQPDLDELMIRKKDRIMPYILVDGEVSEAELVDWYRLALVSKYLSRTVGKNNYPR